jgi:omega-6 fatty acid desaturase (delta-12 desaturase)
MRTGAELNNAVKPFQVEDRPRTLRLLAVTVAALLGSLGAVLAIPNDLWPFRVFSATVAGLIQIRLFIFYHDYLHGALLHGSRGASAFFSVVGVYMMAVRSVWKETHDFHHKHNAKLIGSAIGSFPVVTTGMWRVMSPMQKRIYRFIRHPLSIFGGYFTVFLIGMTFSPFRRDARAHFMGPVSVLIHFGLFALLGFALDWFTAALVVLVPSFVALGLGSYLFFVQHNFPSMQLKDRRTWDYSFAALRSSSMFDMSPIMHWFTGNIGYHHIHHLNHRIPFYRLPEAMAAVPELQSPGRTSWAPQDVLAALALAVWDPDQGRMLTWSEARHLPDTTPQPA